MAVLIDENTKVICQGFTGSQGTLQRCDGDGAAKPDMTVWTAGWVGSYLERSEGKELTDA